MAKKKENQTSKKEKTADKGSRKARTGLPQTDMINAIQYIKKAYEKVGTDLESFKGMADAMGMPFGQAIKVFGELKDYGLIEPQGSGYIITDLGRRAAKDEKSAVIEILEKNNILKRVYNELKDKSFTKSYVEDYIKKARFGYNPNNTLIAERFMSAMDYIKNLGDSGKQEVSTYKSGPIQNSLFLSLIKLKYALTPPGKKEIAKLVQELSEEAKKSDDVVIKSLTKQMMDKKDQEQVLHSLLESLIAIISEKHPSFSFESGEVEESENSE